MRQVLFHIPLRWLSADLPDIPVYGYGAMLFLAFVFCTIFATRRALKEGIAKERIQDLAIWMFIFGIIGARITYMIQFKVPFWPLWNFFKLWDGGLVFYGSALGGAVGYFIYYLLVLRKYQISSWKMADLIAPCAALGLAVGRLGCLLNGCCYGNVCFEEWRALSFPLSAPPRTIMVAKGYQTAAGFTLAARTSAPIVDHVEPGSPASAAGLRPKDRITKVNSQEVFSNDNLDEFFKFDHWTRGKNDLELTVQRDGQEVAIPAFTPRTIGLHPTQIYETISMALLFWLLLAYYPYRRRDGEVMVLFMVCYALHRFFNEMLRTDTDPVALKMTLSQLGSVLVLAAALVLAWILSRKPVQYQRTFPPAPAGADHQFHVKSSPSAIPR
jgi:phosphatidylglycerol:prolipoprotein diacylglycerol transferase